MKNVAKTVCFCTKRHFTAPFIQTKTFSWKRKCWFVDSEFMKICHEPKVIWCAFQVEMGLTWIDHDTIEKPIEEITLGTEEAVDIEFTVETLKSSLNEPQSASTGLPRMKPITKKVMPPLTAVTSSAAAAATVSWVQNRETARIIYEAWKTPRRRRRGLCSLICTRALCNPVLLQCRCRTEVPVLRFWIQWG